MQPSSRVGCWFLKLVAAPQLRETCDFDLPELRLDLQPSRGISVVAATNSSSDPPLHILSLRAYWPTPGNELFWLWLSTRIPPTSFQSCRLSFVVVCGCLAKPISTPDAASFQLTANTIFEFSLEKLLCFVMMRFYCEKRKMVIMLHESCTNGVFRSKSC